MTQATHEAARECGGAGGAAAPRFPHRSGAQALHLLAKAAELEHAALCVYLYAAFSLKRGTDEGLTAEELEAMSAWRKTLFQIARDEMAHLVTVNNLIAAVGGSPHFKPRDDHKKQGALVCGACRQWDLRLVA